MYHKRLYDLIQKPLDKPLDRTDARRLGRRISAMSDDRRDRYLRYVQRLPHSLRRAVLSTIETISLGV